MTSRFLKSDDDRYLLIRGYNAFHVFDLQFDEVGIYCGGYPTVERAGLDLGVRFEHPVDLVAKEEQ